mmetsp:Transcript_31163/g.78989  ORF Transcript_31163/g.78989 Transcript_31163/m.78989 type:complete len:297 (-) Transcript_31163:1030-1920(-)
MLSSFCSAMTLSVRSNPSSSIRCKSHCALMCSAVWSTRAETVFIAGCRRTASSFSMSYERKKPCGGGSMPSSPAHSSRKFSVRSPSPNIFLSRTFRNRARSSFSAASLTALSSSSFLILSCISSSVYPWSRSSSSLSLKFPFCVGSPSSFPIRLSLPCVKCLLLRISMFFSRFARISASFLRTMRPLKSPWMAWQETWSMMLLSHSCRLVMILEGVVSASVFQYIMALTTSSYRTSPLGRTRRSWGLSRRPTSKRLSIVHLWPHATLGLLDTLGRGPSGTKSGSPNLAFLTWLFLM